MTGSVVLSLDFELAWGSQDHSDLGPALERARYIAAEGAQRLIQALVDRELPATWAAVGGLMVDGWDDTVELDQSAVRGRRWEEPARSASPGDAAFFAPGLADRIQDAPHQELGFHGYTHLSFTDRAMTPLRARQELDACRALAQKRGFDGVSWVYPRNEIAHRTVLAASGIQVYRGLDRKRLAALGARAGRRGGLAEGLVTDWLGLPAPAVRPRKAAGMVELPGSTLLGFAEGLRRWLPDPWRRRAWRLAIHRAGRTGRVFHPWLHPVNLWPAPDRKFAVLEGFLDDLVAARQAGVVEVRSMADYSVSESQ